MKKTIELIWENKKCAKAPMFLRINAVVLYLAAAVILAAVLVAGFGVYYTLTLVTAQTLYREESQKHEKLTNALDSINLIVAKETEFISRFSDLETDLSLARGVAPAPEDIKRQSVGGRRYFPDKVKLLLGSPIEIQVSEIDEEIASNRRQLRFLDQRLITINETAERQRIFFAEKPSIAPTRGRISSEFGTRNHPILNRAVTHEGIDIANAPWTPVRAAADGIVSFSGVRGGYGNMVDITHRNSGYLTRYAHLVRSAVNVGDIVRRGDIVGYMGNTGISTGPHLHFEVRRGGIPLNPRGFMLDQAVLY